MSDNIRSESYGWIRLIGFNPFPLVLFNRSLLTEWLKRPRTWWLGKYLPGNWKIWAWRLEMANPSVQWNEQLVTPHQVFRQYVLRVPFVSWVQLLIATLGHVLRRETTVKDIYKHIWTLPKRRGKRGAKPANIFKTYRKDHETDDIHALEEKAFARTL